MTTFDKLTQGLKFEQSREEVLQNIVETFTGTGACPPNIGLHDGCYRYNDNCKKCWQAWLTSDFKNYVPM